MLGMIKICVLFFFVLEELKFTERVEAFVSFGLIGLSPYLGLIVLDVLLCRSTATAIVFVVGATGILAYATYYFLLGFVLNPDAQAGILLIEIPKRQWWGVGAIVLIALLNRLIGRIFRVASQQDVTV